MPHALLVFWIWFGAVAGRAASPEGMPELIHSEPLAPGGGAESKTLFQPLPAAETGIDFVYQWNQDPKYEKLLNSSVVGGGVCAGDYDGDGLTDICLTRPAGGFRLYRNRGNFHFTDVTGQAGLRDEGVWSTGATFVDIDNDGRLDLYVCCYDSPNRLYINQGNGTFSEQAKAHGLDFRGASIMMAFADYDRDGRLDAYLLTGGLMPKPEQRFRVKFVEGRPVVPEELREFWQLIYQPGERAAMAEAGQRDHLFHNTGNGSFTEVSQAAGIAGCDFGNAAVWWDFNGDGWPDLYVANDYFGPDRLYRNNRDGTFTDVAKATLPHTPWTSMGADIADFNRDGLLDLIASDMSGTTHFKRVVDAIDMAKSGWFLELAEPRQYMWNALYLNTGVDRFIEAAHLTGMADTDWTWSILCGDLDNDGWEDVFVPNGMTRDWMDNDAALRAKKLPPGEFTPFWKAQPVRADRNLAFRNCGRLEFQPTAKAWGLDHPGPSFGAVLADLDGDGRLDLVVNDFEAPARVYRNTGREGHRVKMRLHGTAGNRYGLGATLRLKTSDGSQMRYLTAAHGFMSASEPAVHFGLGPCARIDELKVQWPGGALQTFTNLEADRAYTIEESTNAGPVVARAEAPATLFVKAKSWPRITLEEEGVDDFKRQPLLPFKLSQLGPGLAWGDVDVDGRDDLYVSGTTRKPGQFYRQVRPGAFEPEPRLGLTPRVQEMAPLFFDADGDGFPDLYIAAGGNAGEPGDEMLRHRLYLNDGQGHFRPAAAGALPNLRDSGGTVVAADYDRDGDLDLFVGGRLVPGRYPLTPESRLLRNDRGTFTDVTAELAPELRRAGLVTSALWSDVDNDGWLDLLVTCEWGPVRLFYNHHGRLEEQTRAAGLAERLGWWNAIVGADLDNDGDIDYVVSNAGLNTRYQASPEEPCRIYYGDFNGDGQAQLVEARMTRAGGLPLRGKSALEMAIPGLGAKFPTYHAFAAAGLSELFPAPVLDAALKVEVNTLETGVLLNDGRGRFSFHPLPRIAQVAPSYGAVLADIDGDGKLDLYLVQNFHGPQRETGRMDGGVSLLLMGNGDGTFDAVWPDRSGLVVPGDAKSLAVADLNDDGWEDFVVGVNNGEVLAFENRAASTNRVLTVKLAGKPGNPTAVGSRVTLRLANGDSQTREICAGGGYLSQSGSALVFGLGPAGTARELEVRWPDGKVSVHRTGLEGRSARVRRE